MLLFCKIEKLKYTKIKLKYYQIKIQVLKKPDYRE